MAEDAVGGSSSLRAIDAQCTRRWARITGDACDVAEARDSAPISHTGRSDPVSRASAIGSALTAMIGGSDPHAPIVPARALQPGGTLPALDRITLVSGRQPGETPTDGIAPGDELARFAASVVWRSSISSSRHGSCDDRTVTSAVRVYSWSANFHPWLLPSSERHAARPES